MTIKQQGGVFGRNPTFNDATVNEITIDGLRVYFDGTRYMIASPATELRIQTSDFRMVNSANNEVGLKVVENGAATLYWDGASRLATADAGVQITGNVIVANGKGIDFSATSGTGTSELFDDYEEGTWAPVAADASSGGNVAAGGTFTGYYVKIGNSVTAVASLFNVNTAGMTAGNDLYITGLPFTSKTSSGGVIYTGSVIMASTTTSGNNVASINAGDAVARIAENVSGGNADYITVGELSSGTADVRITITYLTE